MQSDERIKVSKEAAKLLYYKFVDNYKNAKKVACNSLRIKSLPSNFEVAMELDKLADEIEGKLRRDLLKNLRVEALQIMDELEPFNPKLVGSVWRGTSRKGSDIDIVVYSERLENVVDLVRKEYDNVKLEFKFKTSEGTTKRYFHVYFNSHLGFDVEVVIRCPEEIYSKNKCEIYGDYVIGLTRHELSKLLETDATKRFLPERKIGWRTYIF